VPLGEYVGVVEFPVNDVARDNHRKLPIEIVLETMLAIIRLMVIAIALPRVRKCRSRFETFMTRVGRRNASFFNHKLSQSISRR
jgi:hypothetical protein